MTIIMAAMSMIFIFGYPLLKFVYNHPNSSLLLKYKRYYRYNQTKIIIRN